MGGDKLASADVVSGGASDVCNIVANGVASDASASEICCVVAGGV